MSKAFTKEDADVPEAPVRRRGVPVPEGVPNYVTSVGARQLREELAGLQTAARDEDGDARLEELTAHLASAELVEPIETWERAGFGSAVTVEDDDGARTTYRIVGAIEADPRTGAISWQSPIARALADSAVGDDVLLPRGEQRVVAIGAA